MLRHERHSRAPLDVRQPAADHAGAGDACAPIQRRLIADQEGVASRLIATVPDLEKLAADDDANIPALKGWRREVFGQEALRLKRGELALVLEQGKVEVVELES